MSRDVKNGIVRRLRWQIDRKNPSFRQASWAIAALAVARGAWLVRSGRGADTGAYFVCLAAITFSILITTFDSPSTNAVIGLIFVGFPLMAIASAAVPPAAGYLGQTMSFCFRAIVVVIVAASCGAKGLRKDTVDKDKAFSQLFLWQLGVVLVFVLAAGLVSPPPPPNAVRQMSNGLVVTPVRVDSCRLSLPFVNGDRCYLTSQYGRLVEIDLNSGEIIETVGLPAPNAVELGFEGYGMQGQRGLPQQALFYGDPNGKLQIAYPYPLEIKREGKTVTDWSNYLWIDVSLPLPTSLTPADWRLGEKPVGATISLQDPGVEFMVLEFGDSSIDRAPPSDRTAPKEVRTVTPLGEASFNLQADGDWAVVVAEDRLLMSTFFGHLYIVRRVLP